MNIYTFQLIRPEPDKSGHVRVNEIKIKACYYEVALKEVLVAAHKFAKENNIPYYRVEGEM
jgi:hypothetical protein